MRYEAGWYADPYASKGSGVLRWYDGSAWTGDVRRPDQGGVRSGHSTVTSVASRPDPGVHRSGMTMPATVDGATWESIPQPGTSYTADALNFPPPRIHVVPVALVVLAVIALIALAFRGG